MKNLLLLFSAILFISCSTEQAEQKNIQPETDEVVDIRIYSDGEIRFNGKFIGESGLKSHIESLNTSKTTRARLIFDETVYNQVIFHAQKQLYINQITNLNTKMLSPKEFKAYNQNKIHIDVLSSGKILFKGQEIYPADLKTTLTNIEIKPETEFIISVSEKAKVGPVFETQKLLADNGHMKLTYEDLSKYHH
jgi:biopolymer transport protein ExbD